MGYNGGGSLEQSTDPSPAEPVQVVILLLPPAGSASDIADATVEKAVLPSQKLRTSNPLKCSYIPKCGKNFEESLSLVNVVMENFKKYQHFSCFYDPDGVQKNVLLTKLYSSNVLFHSLFWPSCMMVGGLVIVAMVKLTQYLSLLCERIQRINR
ncbi:UNVERIFIED_CONTAM: Calcium-activated potassium channel subunit beta-2 [Gekko kuhli]